jgi:hypothetical protein
MNITGLLLFIIGIISALISAAKLPAPNTNLSDLLPIYLLAMVVAMLGLWLWQRSQTLPRADEDASSQTVSRHNILELLPQLRATMQALEQQLTDFNEVTITKRVEDLLNQYVLPLVAAREEVIHLLGRHHGVEVLVAIAQGERLLNRMWSAASDGCLNEVYATFPKALAAFEEAEQYCQAG